MSALATFAVLLYIACLQLADEKGWPWLFPDVDRKSITTTGVAKWSGDICTIQGKTHRHFRVIESDLIEVERFRNGEFA
jgi:hypothetical protein